METRHLVDPQVWPIVDLLPSFVFDRSTLDQTRADSAARLVAGRVRAVRLIA